MAAAQKKMQAQEYEALSKQTLLFMKTTGQKMLLDAGVATTQEASSPSFYSRGQKGYWLALFAQRMSTYSNYSSVHHPDPDVAMKNCLAALVERKLSSVYEPAFLANLAGSSQHVAYQLFVCEPYNPAALKFFYDTIGAEKTLELARAAGDGQLNVDAAKNGTYKSSTYFDFLYENKSLVEKYGVDVFIEIAKSSGRSAFHAFKGFFECEDLVKRFGVKRMLKTVKACGEKAGFVLYALSELADTIKTDAHLSSKEKSLLDFSNCVWIADAIDSDVSYPTPISFLKESGLLAVIRLEEFIDFALQLHSRGVNNDTVSSFFFELTGSLKDLVALYGLEPFREILVKHNPDGEYAIQGINAMSSEITCVQDLYLTADYAITLVDKVAYGIAYNIIEDDYALGPEKASSLVKAALPLLKRHAQTEEYYPLALKFGLSKQLADSVARVFSLDASNPGFILTLKQSSLIPESDNEYAFIGPELKKWINSNGFDKFVELYIKTPSLYHLLTSDLKKPIQKYGIEPFIQLARNAGSNAEDSLKRFADFLSWAEKNGVGNAVELGLELSGKAREFTPQILGLVMNSNSVNKELREYALTLGEIYGSSRADVSPNLYSLEKAGLLNFGLAPFAKIAVRAREYAPAVFAALVSFSSYIQNEFDLSYYAQVLSDIALASKRSPKDTSSLFDNISNSQNALKVAGSPQRMPELFQVCAEHYKETPVALSQALALHMELEAARLETDFLKTLPKFFQAIEQGNALPTDYLTPTLYHLEMFAGVYENAFSFSSAQGSEYADRLAFMFDFSRFAQEINASGDVSSAALALKRLRGLSPRLASMLLEKLHVQDSWFEFNHAKIDDSNAQVAADVIFVSSLMRDNNPKDTKYDKLLSQFTARLFSLRVELSPISDLNSLTRVMDLGGSFALLDKDYSEKFLNSAFESVDLIGLVRSASQSGKANSRTLERIRLMLNRINPVYGDEFILTLGVKLSEEPVSSQNFFSKLEEIAACCFSNPSSFSDVNGLYELVGRFQANSLADFLLQNKGLFSENDFNFAVSRLASFGLELEDAQSGGSKLWRSVTQGNFGYILGKGTSYFSSKIHSAALREQYQEAGIYVKSGEDMRAGFSCKLAFDEDGRPIATIISGNYSKGARVGYTSNVGSGIVVGDLENRFGNSLSAIAVGAYTTGMRKLAEFAVQDGTVSNYLVSNRDGLAVFYPDGTVEIKKVSALKKSDIATAGYQMSEDPLDFRSNPQDFMILAKKFKRAKASAFQGHLLLHNGEVQVAANSSPFQDKRRCLAVMSDGSFALIDFGPKITLLEAAVLARKMGVKDLMNLDTGMYDFSSYYDASGKHHELGTMDSERPTNLVIFFSHQQGKIELKK